jgi:hypothetical protein
MLVDCKQAVFHAARHRLAHGAFGGEARVVCFASLCVASVEKLPWHEARSSAAQLRCRRSCLAGFHLDRFSCASCRNRSRPTSSPRPVTAGERRLLSPCNWR